MKNTSPFLLVLLGLLAGYPAARLAIAPAEEKAEAVKAAAANLSNATPPAAPTPQTTLQESCDPKDKSAPPPWCEPARVLRELFGLPRAPEKTRDDSLGEVVAAAHTAQYDLRFLVALVPAPPDPRLDQALDAIQEGFADAKYREARKTWPRRPTTI